MVKGRSLGVSTELLAREILDEFYEQRGFVLYFYFTGWGHLSLGFHVSLYQPNIEIHVPFGMFRFGWVKPVAGSGKMFGWEFGKTLDEFLITNLKGR